VRSPASGRSKGGTHAPLGSRGAKEGVCGGTLPNTNEEHRPGRNRKRRFGYELGGQAYFAMR